MASDLIKSVECFTIELPLERTLWASGLEITKREFFAVKIETEQGRTGFEFRKSRGLNLDRIVTDNLLPHLFGSHPADVERIWDAR